MANVTIETKVWNDPRFKILAARLKKSKFDVIGRVAALWEYCTEHEKHHVTGAEIEAVCELKNFGRALASSDVNLATHGGDEFYIAGTLNRIEWLAKLRKTGRNGGLARSKNASRRRDGRFKAKRKAGPGKRLAQRLASAGPAPSVLIPTITTTPLSAAPLGGDRAPLIPPLPPKVSIKSVDSSTENFEQKKAEAMRQVEILLAKEKIMSDRLGSLQGPPADYSEGMIENG